MISYPFFELFSVEARIFAAKLDYQKGQIVTKWEQENTVFYLCPLGACCLYDNVISFNSAYYLPSGKDLAEPLGVSENEINSFIFYWETEEILAEDLPLVMGIS
jgi:hypothetical protein